MHLVKYFTYSPLQENTYIVQDGRDNCVIIDPGCLSQNEKDSLKNYIIQENLIVKALLQTHTHLDHVFGSNYVKRTFGVQMYMHEADLPVLNDVEARCNMWNIKGYEPVEPDVFIQDGEQLTFGDIILDVIHVPGHAPGHVAFINHKERYVIGGDCLFKGSIGRTDFPLCSHEQLINSIRTKFFTLPDDYTIYAGHMDSTTIGHEKKYNPFFK